MPDIWISDNAGPFIFEFLETINRLTSTKHRYGNSRYLQSQNAIEITNAELNKKVRLYLIIYQDT